MIYNIILNLNLINKYYYLIFILLSVRMRRHYIMLVPKLLTKIIIQSKQY